MWVRSQASDERSHDGEVPIAASLTITCVLTFVVKPHISCSAAYRPAIVQLADTDMNMYAQLVIVSNLEAKTPDEERKPALAELGSEFPTANTLMLPFQAPVASASGELKQLSSLTALRSTRSTARRAR